MYIYDISGAIRFQLSNISETTSSEYFPSFRNINWPIIMLISCERVAISWRLVGTARGLKREEKKKERDRDRGQGERKRERERRREREWRCEDVKMRRWEDVMKMRRCEDEKREREKEREWRWEDVKMRTWENVMKVWWRCDEGAMKMWRWQDVKMWWRCDDDVMMMWWWCDEDVNIWRCIAGGPHY